MTFLIRGIALVAMAAGVVLVPIKPAPASAAIGELSVGQRHLLARAARLAASDPRQAARWLSRHVSGKPVLTGRDGRTLTFRAWGRTIALVPAATPLYLPTARRAFGARRSFQSAAHQHSSADAPGGARAVVLEPFADELNQGASAGSAEVASLQAAGFQVDVLRNAAVTEAVMENLNWYSFVYMETHSGTLPNGDAVVATGETDPHPYAALYAEHSMVQVLVAGDTAGTLYNGITMTFVSKHMGVFTSNSIAFLNGCSVLRAPAFFGALQARGVTAMISWDDEVDSATNAESGRFVLDHLARGDSITGDLAQARALGLAVSVVGNTVAHLGFLGDGTNTLARAAGTALVADSTSTSTATPTLTPTPTATAQPAPHKKVNSRRKCRPGHHRVHGKCRPNHHVSFAGRSRSLAAVTHR